MECGIARFGRRSLKTTEIWKFWSQNLSPGVSRRSKGGVSRHSNMGFRGAAEGFRALRANISLISIHWWFCCLCLKNEKCDIVGWRAFLNRFVLFLLQKFNTYTTPKDGMEIWVHCNFYTPLLRSGGTDSRIQNLWWRPSGPWLKLWVGGCIHLEKCDIT